MAFICSAVLHTRWTFWSPRAGCPMRISSNRLWTVCALHAVLKLRTSRRQIYHLKFWNFALFARSRPWKCTFMDAAVRRVLVSILSPALRMVRNAGTGPPFALTRVLFKHWTALVLIQFCSTHLCYFSENWINSWPNLSTWLDLTIHNHYYPDVKLNSVSSSSVKANKLQFTLQAQ